MRPRIGISAYWRAASWGPWTDMPACMVPQGYVEGVHAAGGVALLLPPDPDHAGDDAASVLEVLDGLVLVGGEDIGPANYDSEPHPSTDPANVRRDQSELALARGAIARDMPVLGVCRGFQLLNIVYGGDLEQHVGDVTDPAPHRPRLGQFGRHDVEITGGHLREILGARAGEIHSHHHQGIGRKVRRVSSRNASVPRRVCQSACSRNCCAIFVRSFGGTWSRQRSSVRMAERR